jgi:bud site selection protein 31
LIEEVILDFESQMKEAVNEEHEGKRKCELNWKVHRIHWEKNRFIYDLMYVRKVMERELVSPLPKEKPALTVKVHSTPVHSARDQLSPSDDSFETFS